MKIKIKPIKQTKGYCGPACMKIIMDPCGINRSQNYWAKQTKTNRKNGCSEKEMVRVAEKLGFKSYIKHKSTIKELRDLLNKGSMIIVDWFSPEEAGHYSVVAGFEGNKILLADPHFGKIVRHDIKWFEERWFDVINDKLLIKQIIVIRK